MKIYTGTGDGGRTSLLSGERTAKNDIRVKTYGMIDELCSFIGAVDAAVPPLEQGQHVSRTLRHIQADLFAIGTILATTPNSQEAELLKPLDMAKAEWLEKEIDAMDQHLKELHTFILPGGHPSAAWAQVVRTICRRAERDVVTLQESEGCLYSREILAYLNRLSDFFFVLARYLNMLSGTEERPWHG
jgi:cob(I)alamin adenosyltransferase